MQLNGPDQKESRNSYCHLKYAFMVKQNAKWKLLLLKIQPDGSDKKEIRNRLILKYNYSSGKMKWKM